MMIGDFIQVEIRPGVFVAHTFAEYTRFWRGVDREAALAMTAPLEDDALPAVGASQPPPQP